jgi:lipoprotein-anchoring transpeptidase ErfK/SrfK
MRTWLVILLGVGVGTAGGFHWWRGKNDRSTAVAQAAESDGSELGTATPESGCEGESEGVSPAPEELEPTSPDPDEALVAEAPEAMSSSASTESREVEIPGGATAETEAEARRKASGLVEQAAKSASPIEQSRLLTQALLTLALDREADEKAYQALLEANQRGILNPRIDELCMRTEVRNGDSLWKICKRVEKETQIRVAPGLVRLVNGLATDRIYTGARLKIPNSQVSILVEKSRFRLSVFLGDLILKRYHVGLGKSNRTPEGQFTIASRLKDPTWNKPNSAPVPPESPENVLGTRWLGFAPKDDFPEAATFGIHGTREDDSIGKEASQGCVRMHNVDVEEIFEWIAEGVKVEIRP